jgi:ATP-dependent DNA helicase RecG
MGVTGNIGERFIDNQRIEGTLEKMLDEAIKFIMRNMRTKTIINKSTGKREDITEYPIIAVRELLLNALIHRDYSIHTDTSPITIKMFSDRIEIESPGGLYGRMTIDQLGKMSADTRNPFIANAMEVMELTENRYSGIPTIKASMTEANLPEPKFESEYGIFRATLYNDHYKSTAFESGTFSEKQLELIEFCKTPRSRAEIAEYFKGRTTINYVMSDYLHPLVEKGIIKLAIPDKPKSKNQKYLFLAKNNRKIERRF